MKFTRYLAIIVFVALATPVVMGFASEFISDCHDCCDETTCNEDSSCYCCSFIAGVILEINATGELNSMDDAIEVLASERFESLSYELIDPPPR